MHRTIGGGLAMWIVFYVAMIASLRAMGLASDLMPVKTEENRNPYGDL